MAEAKQTPRNLFEYAEVHGHQLDIFGKRTTLKVRQVLNDPEVWPGGALWDSGVLLARLFADPQLSPVSRTAWRSTTVLEIGTGTGLTGLVCAALGARQVLLTDLPAVVEKVTAPNVAANRDLVGPATVDSRPRLVATPLTWGVPDDIAKVLEMVARPGNAASSGGLAAASSSSSSQKKGRSRRRQQQQQQQQQLQQQASPPARFVDLVIGGDISYKSDFFDALLDTVLQLCPQPPPMQVCHAEADEGASAVAGGALALAGGGAGGGAGDASALVKKTAAPGRAGSKKSKKLSGRPARQAAGAVAGAGAGGAASSCSPLFVFGHRHRFEGSGDLLDCIMEHFEEVLPPLDAAAIEPRFAKVKHNITIFFLRRRRAAVIVGRASDDHGAAVASCAGSVADLPPPGKLQ